MSISKDTWFWSMESIRLSWQGQCNAVTYFRMSCNFTTAKDVWLHETSIWTCPYMGRWSFAIETSQVKKTVYCYIKRKVLLRIQRSWWCMRMMSSSGTHWTPLLQTTLIMTVKMAVQSSLSNRRAEILQDRFWKHNL